MGNLNTSPPPRKSSEEGQRFGTIKEAIPGIDFTWTRRGTGQTRFWSEQLTTTTTTKKRERETQTSLGNFIYLFEVPLKATSQRFARHRVVLFSRAGP